MTSTLNILQGDWSVRLCELPEKSVHCCVTSPPYWGLRDYGVPGQLGLEKTPEEYVAKLVTGFREVWRVLRDDGTLWLNLGDSYCGGGNYRGTDESTLTDKQRSNRGAHGELAVGRTGNQPPTLVVNGLKPKDLVGIPWRVAFALQADGWYLRSDIIWHKPNPMPESVTDRPTKSHEYIFLLSKQERYFFDAEAIKEPYTESSVERYKYSAISKSGKTASSDYRLSGPESVNGFGVGRSTAGLKSHEHELREGGRNKRTVWTVATEPYSEAHFATFPTDLIKPCILAGTSAKGCCSVCGAPWERVVESPRYSGCFDRNDNGDNRTERSSNTLGWKPCCECCVQNNHVAPDQNGHVMPYQPIPCTILDPFAGSGTTGQVAIELGRNATLIELNPKYVELIKQRTFVTPGLALA